jgi:proline-specific peptidase
MSATTPVHEGHVPFRGYRTWYRVVGEREEPGKLPLLCLHGGPGAPSPYLDTLEPLADTGRRVIRYDQLGCGNSDQPDDPSLWTIPTFVAELGAVREALGLEHVHLLGQSWGGMLALEYALTRPTGLASIILADSTASVSHWVAEANRLRAELPPDIQAILRHHEETGTTDDPAYMDAGTVFYQRHVCRMDPWPPSVAYSLEHISQPVFQTMWGPSEFHATGLLRDWDITDRLGEISTPTLILSGRYDESTPALNETLQRGIRGSEWIVFEESAHVPNAEEPERFRAVLADFLDRVEQS